MGGALSVGQSEPFVQQTPLAGLEAELAGKERRA